MPDASPAPATDLTIPAVPAGGLLSAQTLLLVLCGVFTGFFVCGDIIGNKGFSFTFFGLDAGHIGLADPGSPFVATVGLFAFPLTFILTDIVNEYFGRRIVVRLTAVAVVSLLCLLPVITAAVQAPTVSFAPGVSSEDFGTYFQFAVGPAPAIIIGSTVAFITGQLLDISLFSWLRRRTGGRMLWLRAQASTVGSQLIDSFVVIFLAFVILPNLFGIGTAKMSPTVALNVSITNYVIKFIISIGIVPVLYLVHFLIRLLLGRVQADALVAQAHPQAQ